jgi:hypothetical protein
MTSSPTGILEGGITQWSEPSNVNIHLAGEVVVRTGGHVVASTYDAGGPFGFRFILPEGIYKVSANGAEITAVVRPDQPSVVELIATYGQDGRSGG